jgi:hypothetical protein
MCFAPREDDMARATVEGGYTNASAGPGEPGYVVPDPPADPIPVADQKAAGVPPDQTVTIAEQKAGTPPPPLPVPMDPDDAEPNEDAVARQWATGRGITIPDSDPVPDYVLQAYRSDTSAPQQGA